MSIKFFPTNFVSFRKVENHEEIKAQILPHILHYAERYKNNREYLWDSNTKSNMITTYNHGANSEISQLILNKYIRNIIWDPFKEVVDYAGVMGFNDAGVTNLWWNYYNPGDYGELHAHSNAAPGTPNYSGVYFLDLKEENTLEFYSPFLSSSHPVKSTCHYMNTNDITEGMVCIFPASLMHQVKPVKKRRITLSFNIACRYPFMDPNMNVYPTDNSVRRPERGWGVS
jgi:hypothetical protein